jgi:outer membrane receptor for ferrienterochelin and colicins
VPRPLPVSLLAAALALLLLSAPAVAASSTADEADVAFELGNEAYAKGNFHLALQQYFTSYRLVPNRSVLFNIARSYEALERYTEAYRYYEDLAAQADALDAEDATEVRRSLERLRPRVALVRVESTPRGADVYVNRLDQGSRGKTPLTLSLPPGRHRLLLRKEGHRPVEAWVNPVKGRQQLQSLELPLITGTVQLAGSPAGARVREGGPDGPVLGQLPATLALSAGRHVLHVSAEGHASRTLEVEVPAEGSVAAQVALGPALGPSGTLKVTASRPGARVRVDGRDVGAAPLSLRLPEGEHTLEVESDEVRPVRQVVRLVRDRELPVHVELRHVPPPVLAATRSLRAQDEAPASTTVLSQEELRAFGYTTLAEALAGVRGFFLTDDRRYTTVGVRGLAPPGDLSSRVLVLWDGHPLHDGVTAHGPVGRDLAVDLDEVERIEVVRGALSALYGSGAELGVINVVPRASLGTGQHLEVTGALGALGALRGHATAAWEGAGTGSAVLLSGAVSRMRGADFTALGEGRPTVEGLDAERSAGASARARVGHLTLLGQLHTRRKELPTAPAGTVVGAPGSQVQDVRGFAEARYERTLSERLQLSLRGSYDASRHHEAGVYAGAPLVRRTATQRADWLGGEARLGMRVGGAHRLTLGLEAQGQLRLALQRPAPEGSGAQDLEAPERALVSASVHDEWQLHPRLTLHAGLRVDHASDLDSLPVSPRLALLARPYASGLTRLAAGRAFRAPTAFELYATSDADTGAPTQRPAQALAAETLTTLEAEHTHTLSEALRLTVGGYHHRFSDRLVLDVASGADCGAGGCLAYRNASGVTKAWGLETGVHWQPGRRLLVDVSYAWVGLQDAGATLEAGTPAHLAVARLLVPVADGSVRLATQATYQGARGDAVGPAGGEALLVGFGVSGDHGRLRYFAGVNNLLDSAYALPALTPSAADAIPQYRRTFTLQLTGTY